LDFGVGIGVSFDLSGRDRVVDASVVNGVVRVNEENNDQPRALLETHYFFDWKVISDSSLFAYGPFCAIQPGGDDVIQAIGGGLMVGMRPDRGSVDSFNLAIGALLDTHVKSLGDGVEKNKALPAGETQVRYKDSSQWGLLVMLSYGF
jgi:hypothetical protein